DTQMGRHDFFKIMGADGVLFDEAQIFTDELVEMVSDIVGEGKTVYVAGLNTDYKLKTFETTVKLIGIEDEVNVLTAICADCAKQGATVTIKTSGSDDRIELGSEDIYKPVCTECYLTSAASFKGGDK
ncbi:thymidine kinase, partial [Bacillus atrophaeus]